MMGIDREFLITCKLECKDTVSFVIRVFSVEINIPHCSQIYINPNLLRCDSGVLPKLARKAIMLLKRSKEPINYSLNA